MGLSRVGALGLAMAIVSGTGLGAQELVDGIAAQVGADIVLISEVRQLAEPMEAELQAAGAPPEEIAKLRTDVLEGLVERALISQIVRRNELRATDAEVDHAVRAIAAENQLTAEQLQRSVEAQGLPFEHYREKIRGEVEHNRVIQGMVASRVRIDEREIRAIFDQELQKQPTGGTEVHLRHLLVPFVDADEAKRQAACAAAETALAQIQAGSDFREVATKFSPIPRGGDLGWLHESSLASWMGPAVAALEPGATSPVLRTPFGCNVLQMVERRGFRPLVYEEVRDQIYARLFNERMQKEYFGFIEKLREQTYIERKGLFADAARSALPGGVGLGDGAP